MTVVFLQHSALHYGVDGVIGAQEVARARDTAPLVGPTALWFLDHSRIALTATGPRS